MSPWFPFKFHRPRRLGWLSLACLLVFWGAGAGAAEKTARFELRTVMVTPPESSPMPRCIVTLETNQISFLPPLHWRVVAQAPEQKVVMSPSDGSMQLSFRIWPEYAGKTNVIDRQDLVPLVEQQFAHAKIAAEYPCHTPSGSGFTFELVLPTASGTAKLHTRIAFIQLPVGLAEIQFLCPESTIRTARFDYNRFLTSFSLEPSPNGEAKAPAK
jgi:hypothetical protein